MKLKVFRKICVLALSGSLLVGCGTTSQPSAVDKEETKKELNLVLDQPGTYEDTGFYDLVTISAKDVVLKGSTIKELVITEEVGEGDVTLVDIKVTGKLSVFGGGSHSIHIKNSEINELITAKKGQPVRVVFEEGATWSGDFSATNCIVIIKSGAIVGSLTLNARSSIELEEGASLESLRINEGASDSKIIINGDVKFVDVSDSVKIEGNGSIGEISSHSEKMIVVDSSIRTSTEGSSANNNMTINMPKPTTQPKPTVTPTVTLPQTPNASTGTTETPTVVVPTVSVKEGTTDLEFITNSEVFVNSISSVIITDNSVSKEIFAENIVKNGKNFRIAITQVSVLYNGLYDVTVKGSKSMETTNKLKLTQGQNKIQQFDLTQDETTGDLVLRAPEVALRAVKEFTYTGGGVSFKIVADDLEINGDEARVPFTKVVEKKILKIKYDIHAEVTAVEGYVATFTNKILMVKGYEKPPFNITIVELVNGELVVRFADEVSYKEAFNIRINSDTYGPANITKDEGLLTWTIASEIIVEYTGTAQLIISDYAMSLSWSSTIDLQ